MEQPTCRDLLNKVGFTVVLRESDDSWRHGCYIYEVFKRDSDNTFWAANYCRSTDGETNELREGTAEIFEVEPKEITTTTYSLVKKNESN